MSRDRLRLAVIDVGWPGAVPELVEALDQAGYHRLWLTEHRTPNQSASPTLLAALAAGLSERIRVGTAGILLRYASPLRVAEDLKLLNLFFPGRLDLGVAGARVPAKRARLLGADPEVDDYAGRARELAQLVSTWKLDGEPIGPAVIDDPGVELWICGMGVGSARLAGEIGASYAYHHYLDSARNGQAALEAYRSSFVPSSFAPAPRVSVAAYGICGPDATEERWNQVMSADGESIEGVRRGRQPPKPSFLGNPNECISQLAALRARYAADELVIYCFAEDTESRVRAYRQLAEAGEIDAS